MHSVKKKLLVLMCMIVLGTYFLIAFSVSHEFHLLINNENTASMNTLAKEKVNELNLNMLNIENAVRVLEEYILDTINLEDFKKDQGYSESYIEDLHNKAVAASQVAGNVIAFYFRPEAVSFGSTSGLLSVKNRLGQFNKVPPTDILHYPSNDREHVSWYYEPKMKGEALWIEPYRNKNLNFYMISYVVPLFKDGVFFGVVGMDMNMTYIHKIIDDITYQNGFGFLMTRNGSLVYHRDYPEGKAAIHFGEELKAASEYLTKQRKQKASIIYKYQNEKHYLAGEDVRNGMILAISAPLSQVMAPYYTLRLQMILVLVFVLIAIFIALRFAMHHVILPIRELTNAASRIAKGELNTPILYKSDDEIGLLSDSIRKMAGELQEYINYIHKQAYTDAMTGVGNQAAYMDFTKFLDRKILEGMADFVVIMFDVNGLKMANDTYGHEAGDQLICDAAMVIKESFGESHVYRIGGDEFIVILENISTEEMGRLFNIYNANLKTTNEKTEKIYNAKLSISHGHAVYMPGEEYKTVFQRADGEMYRNKEKFYQGKNDRRRR